MCTFYLSDPNCAMLHKLLDLRQLSKSDIAKALWPLVRWSESSGFLLPATLKLSKLANL